MEIKVLERLTKGRAAKHCILLLYNRAEKREGWEQHTLVNTFDRRRSRFKGWVSARGLPFDVERR